MTSSLSSCSPPPSNASSSHSSHSSLPSPPPPPPPMLLDRADMDFKSRFKKDLATVRRRQLLPDLQRTRQQPALAAAAAAKKVSSACGACKRRKHKCDSGTPCSRCQAHGTACVYDLAADRRRIATRNHNTVQLQRNRDLLKMLLQTIRFGESGMVTSVVSTLRSDRSLDDMLAVIRLTHQSLDIHEDASGTFSDSLDHLPAIPDLAPTGSHVLQQRQVMTIYDMCNTALS